MIRITGCSSIGPVMGFDVLFHMSVESDSVLKYIIFKKLTNKITITNNLSPQKNNQTKYHASKWDSILTTILAKLNLDTIKMLARQNKSTQFSNISKDCKTELLHVEGNLLRTPITIAAAFLHNDSVSIKSICYCSCLGSSLYLKLFLV